MKYFFLLSISLFLGCQKTDVADQKKSVMPERVAQTEEELAFKKSDFVFIPNIPGLKIEGENISKSGDLTIAEDLKIFDLKDKLLDDFSLFDWGPVSFKIEGHFLRVYPVKDVLEVVYETNDKGLVGRKSQCVFKTRPEGSKFETLMAETNGAKPDWESIFSSVGELAINGDKKSADFFLNPDSHQKKLHKNSDGGDSLEQTIKVLRFMKKEGCQW